MTFDEFKSICSKYKHPYYSTMICKLIKKNTGIIVKTNEPDSALIKFKLASTGEILFDWLPYDTKENNSGEELMKFYNNFMLHYKINLISSIIETGK